MAAPEVSSVPEITLWLVRWRAGDEQALHRLTGLVYAELLRMAAALLRGESVGHTLQSTALVHELYLRLTRTPDIDWQCRGQFFAVSARLMRQILVDHARKRSAAKRGGGFVALDRDVQDVPGPDVLQLHASLIGLAKQHPRQAAVVELRFFGGLSGKETVEALDAMGETISLRTVERDWRFARAWLQDRLGER